MGRVWKVTKLTALIFAMLTIVYVCGCADLDHISGVKLRCEKRKLDTLTLGNGKYSGEVRAYTSDSVCVIVH